MTPKLRCPAVLADLSASWFQNVQVKEECLHHHPRRMHLSRQTLPIAVVKKQVPLKQAPPKQVLPKQGSQLK
jgi:hypothetical protein